MHSVTPEEGLSKGPVAAYLIVTGPSDIAWLMEHWFMDGMTTSFAEELAATFLRSLKAGIRPQG